MAAWASPLHFRVHAAYRTGTKLRTVVQREDEQKWEWMIPQEGGSTVGGVKRRTPSPGGGEQHSCEVSKLRGQTPKHAKKSDLTSPKNETTSNTFSNDSRSVPPKGSVLLQALRHRALCGSADSGPGRARGFPVGLAHDVHDDGGGHPDASQRSAAAVVLQPTRMLDGTVQRLQRRIQQTPEQIRDPSRQPPSRTPTAVLGQLRDRIQAIALDMSALNQSCNVDSNTPRAPQEPPRPAACRRAPPQTQTKRRSGVAGVERNIVFSGQGDFTEKASAVLQGTHTTSLPRTHPDCHFASPPHQHLPFPRQLLSPSRCTTSGPFFTCSVTYSLQIKTDVKHECGQPAVAGTRALLEHPGPWKR